jgi:glycosyltransferase involved in cell wall biosynthesis
MKKPLVSVIMITFGHENFIEQAINGVLMQICDFDIELIISNDCSPDKTDHVIQNILKDHKHSSWIKYFKQETNLGMMPNFIFSLEQCKGNYIALCEGDDYWIDPLKLQRQVDFLENNTSYVMACHCIYELKLDVLNEADWRCNKNRAKYKLEDYLYKLFFHTSSVVYKNFELPPYIKSDKILNGDYAVFSYLLTKGNLYYFNEIMSVYRIHDAGISNSDLHKKIHRVFESKNYIFENINSVTNFAYSKYIWLNILIEKEILLMNSGKSSYNINRIKYWIYKLIYKFQLFLDK